MNKLSIIIPTFNEEKTIKELIGKVLSAQLPSGVTKEVIVVDDGSTDKTSKVLSEFIIYNLKFKIYKHKINQGKGAAIKTGIEKATGNLILIQDADLEYDPKYYSQLLEPILKNNAQVVYGSRLVNYPLRLWGKDKTPMPFHLLANKALTILTNILYEGNLTDMETCYKVFKKEIVNRMQLNAKGFDFEPEITVKILKLGIPILEIPIIVKPRSYKQGKKIGLQDGVIAVWTLLKYKFVD